MYVTYAKYENRWVMPYHSKLSISSYLLYCIDVDHYPSVASSQMILVCRKNVHIKAEGNFHSSNSTANECNNCFDNESASINRLFSEKNLDFGGVDEIDTAMVLVQVQDSDCYLPVTK